MWMQEQRAAKKMKKEQTASKEAKKALLDMVKHAAQPPAPKKAAVVSKSVKKAETLVREDGKKVPMSSRHDPSYVHAEDERDAEAQLYLKKLQHAKEAALAKKAHTIVKVAPRKREQDRNEIAEKYLAIMEKQALKKHVTKKQAEDRTLLAQKYLAELKKVAAKPHSNAVKGSRHSPAYVHAEQARDKQAAVDMELLKKVCCSC